MVEWITLHVTTCSGAGCSPPACQDGSHKYIYNTPYASYYIWGEPDGGAPANRQSISQKHPRDISKPVLTEVGVIVWRQGVPKRPNGSDAALWLGISIGTAPPADPYNQDSYTYLGGIAPSALPTSGQYYWLYGYFSPISIPSGQSVYITIFSNARYSTSNTYALWCDNSSCNGSFPCMMLWNGNTWNKQGYISCSYSCMKIGEEYTFADILSVNAPESFNYGDTVLVGAFVKNTGNIDATIKVEFYNTDTGDLMCSDEWMIVQPNMIVFIDCIFKINQYSDFHGSAHSYSKPIGGTYGTTPDDILPFMIKYQEISGSAMFLEESAKVGDAIHALYEWQNAKWNSQYQAYAIAVIQQPDSSYCVDYYAQVETGSATLECLTTMAGTHVAFIWVWDGGDWITAEDYLDVTQDGEINGELTYFHIDPNPVPTGGSTTISMTGTNTGSTGATFILQCHTPQHGGVYSDSTWLEPGAKISWNRTISNIQNEQLCTVKLFYLDNEGYWIECDSEEQTIYLEGVTPCADYQTQSECESAGCYWWDSSCHSSPSSEECEKYISQSECEAAGCYWYPYPNPFNESSCHNKQWYESYMPYILTGVGGILMLTALLSRAPAPYYYPPPSPQPPQYYHYYE